jgi:diadenosine tetraphosphatase ApaH/serine/threonine PP2A family protein phosphatase
MRADARSARSSKPRPRRGFFSARRQAANIDRRHSTGPAVRIALFSDIHANLEALEACLAHASTQRAERHALLGDFVGYGADAAPVIDIVMREARAGHVVVKGNHDAAIGSRAGGYFNEQAQAALDWARETLGDEHKRFLAELPLRSEHAPSLFVHASADTPERWTYIDSPGAALRCAQSSGWPYTFCGHVHDQVLYFETVGGRMSAFRPRPGTPIPMRDRRRWVAVVGSVGQPRDRNPSAAYALFDDVRRELTFFRVAYDHHAAAEKIRRAGLPASLAFRVETGI